jgi:ADP-ribose pyrophosphatase YjhB (NUDIX family)
MNRRWSVHPRLDDAGRPVALERPSVPTPLSTWSDEDAVACTVPDGPMPASLGGIPFGPWLDVPRGETAWRTVPGRLPSLVEPPLPASPGRAPASGAVVVEPDGRVWLVSPSNRFGGHEHTFPKGRLDGDTDPQVQAIREAWEESGLRIEIFGLVGDFRRTVTTTRYYLARRVGGTPSAMGWESQAVSLVPMRRLREFLTSSVDRAVAARLLD